MNGIICIDKPQGITSFDVVSKMRRIFSEKHIGHAGTLDPMATGVLPVFMGEATKAISLLPCQDKNYVAGLRLGITTDTGDITGKVLSRSDVNITKEEVEKAVYSFRGEVEQVPPMYSAIKQNGKHLYELAREGKEVERAARKINIYDIKVLGRENSGDYIINVSCSKGTYIRTLCEDIGQKLGCGATMASLRRTFAAGFDIERCYTLETVKSFAEKDKLDDLILDVEYIFRDLPELNVTEKQKERFRNGGGLSFDRLLNSPQSGLCRVKCGKLFIGIGIADREKRQINVRCHFNRNIAAEA